MNDRRSEETLGLRVEPLPLLAAEVEEIVEAGFVPFGPLRQAVFLAEGGIPADGLRPGGLFQAHLRVRDARELNQNRHGDHAHDEGRSRNDATFCLPIC